MSDLMPLVICFSAAIVAVWWVAALVNRTIRAFSGHVEGERPVLCKGCGQVMFWTSAGGVGLCGECDPDGDEE